MNTTQNGGVRTTLPSSPFTWWASVGLGGSWHVGLLSDNALCHMLSLSSKLIFDTNDKDSVC
jgi:hypothetical protein